MNLDWLRYYHAVLECGSLNKASERLFISRSSLRANLSALEAEIGAPLLIYDKSGCHPTELGQQIDVESAELFQFVNNWKQRARGSVDSINILSDRLFCEIVLTPLILRFAKTNPPIHVAFNSVAMMDVFTALKERRCHMGIVSSFKKDQQNLKMILPGKDWQMEELFTDQFYVFLNRSHPLHDADQINLSELKDSMILWLSNAQHYSEQFDNGFYDLFDGDPPDSNDRAIIDSHYNGLSIISSDPGFYGVFTGMMRHSPTYHMMEDKICMIPLVTSEPLINTYNLISLKEELQSKEEKKITRVMCDYLRNLLR